MKLRIAVWGILLALCVAPAFADSLSFKNEDMLSGSASNSGISMGSSVTALSFNSTIIALGPCGSISFDTGSFTGSLFGGGSFSSGTFQIVLNGFGEVLFSTNFSGTVTRVGDDLFKLVGAFSGVTNGVSLAGTTTQFFELENEDGHLSFDEVHGNTVLTAAPVPEPGTLTMLGTGLLGLAGVIRRKFAA